MTKLRLLIFLLLSAACYGQGSELSCTAPAVDMLAPTYNPTTGKTRSWVCQNPVNGTVSSPVFGSGTGTVTSLTATAPVVATPATITTTGAFSCPTCATTTNGGLLVGVAPVTVDTSGNIGCATCGVTGNPLSQFATTTSAQLASVISNETGTGLLMFATNPTFTTGFTVPAAGATIAPVSGTTVSLLTSGSNTWNIADGGLDDILIGGGTTEIDAGTTVLILGGSSQCNMNTSGLDCGGVSGITADNGPLTATLGDVNGRALKITGTKFAASGCSNSTTVGGATAGKYNSGTTGTCTVTITMGNSETAVNGWRCTADDMTTNADKQTQSAFTTTTATITGTTVTGDQIVFACVGF